MIVRNLNDHCTYSGERRIANFLMKKIGSLYIGTDLITNTYTLVKGDGQKEPTIVLSANCDVHEFEHRTTEQGSYFFDGSQADLDELIALSEIDESQSGETFTPQFDDPRFMYYATYLGYRVSPVGYADNIRTAAREASKLMRAIPKLGNCCYSIHPNLRTEIDGFDSFAEYEEYAKSLPYGRANTITEP